MSIAWQKSTATMSCWKKDLQADRAPHAADRSCPAKHEQRAGHTVMVEIVKGAPQQAVMLCQAIADREHAVCLWMGSKAVLRSTSSTEKMS